MERLVSKEVSGKLHVYMPGNGTRYEVLICSTPYGDDSFLFCWLRAGEKGLGKNGVFQGKEWGLLHYNYFKEKMDCNDADAAPLLVLIYEITGRAVCLPPEYGPDGNWTGEDVEVCLGVTPRGVAALAKELVGKNHAAQVELSRLKELVLDLYENDGLTLRAERNDNGPDRYFCPACGGSSATRGGALEFCANLDEVTHKSDCALVALRREIDSWE